MKKYLLALFCLIGTLTAAAGETVGVSMPSKVLPRWTHDGENLKAALEKDGFKVRLLFGVNNNVSNQVNDVENMIDAGCRVLVIAPIDGLAFTEVLRKAEAHNPPIPVIAYDRMIMNTAAVAYYASFDSTQVGAMQAQFIKEKLDLDNAAGPFNLEIFTGDAGDPNVELLFNGAMSVLKPYLDAGKLRILSGQREREQCYTKGWLSEAAQARLEGLISSVGYGRSEKLDAVLCQNDTVANGVTDALLAGGYHAANFPLITGQDCDTLSVVNMRHGLQAMSVFKDTRALAAQVALAVKALVAGETPVSATTYNNGQKTVPAQWCDAVPVTPDKIDAVLVKSGYYQPADVAGDAKQ
ncbi:MAG: sugar-binding protein [Planctomycetota bacterium]|jgi:putative multiple sugar transport system substrate-binding protein|nr:sugar-binding protein [Planctomycetota bacterium]